MSRGELFVRGYSYLALQVFNLDPQPSCSTAFTIFEFVSITYWVKSQWENNTCLLSFLFKNGGICHSDWVSPWHISISWECLIQASVLGFWSCFLLNAYSGTQQVMAQVPWCLSLNWEMPKERHTPALPFSEPSLQASREKRPGKDIRRQLSICQEEMPHWQSTSLTPWFWTCDL